MHTKKVFNEPLKAAQRNPLAYPFNMTVRRWFFIILSFDNGQENARAFCLHK